MTLSEMRQILDSNELRLTRSLGQNFLHDGNQLRKIAASARLMDSDRVLEIGPGLGPLTELLLSQAAAVIAIEKDQRLVELLKQRLGENASLTLISADALDYLRDKPRDWSAWKLVANLPYSVASPILVELALLPKGPQMMVATLQLEVAQRIASQPGKKDYGLLSLLLQLNYEPQGLFPVPRTCFFPEPSIDSACIALERRRRGLLPQSHQDAFVRIAKRAFSQRRKMMMKLLRQDWPAAVLEEAFSHAELTPQVRAEAVSLEQFIELTRRLNPA